MKKTLLIAAAALAAGIISTQASSVYSQNIVGYVNVNIPGGNAYTQLSAPVGSGTNIENSVSAIQVGDNVFIWTGGGYNALTYLGVNWDGNNHNWIDANGNGVDSPIISAGQAIFYQNGQSAPETNSFVGNVTLSNSIVIPGGNAYSMLASTAPVADTLDGTNMALPLQVGDNAFVWTGGGYTAITYLGVNWDGNNHNWIDNNGNGTNSPLITPGQGFFYQNGQSGSETWNQNVVIQ